MAFTHENLEVQEMNKIGEGQKVQTSSNKINVLGM